MPEPTINFTHNWNSKLFCKCFTTIRLKNDYKYQVGRTYHIQLGGKDIGPGVIAAISDFKLSGLNNFMAQIDTGYSVEAAKQVILTMYKNRGLNWDTQLLSFILIEMPEKQVMPLPESFFGTWQDAPETEADKAANFPKSLFAKS